MIKLYGDCTCEKNKKYLKGDWGWFSGACGVCVGHDWGKEVFRRYTLKHKIRLWIGTHGQRHDGSYVFSHLRRFDWILNHLIGFKKL